ncbi:MAG TPA: acyltransferase [Luteimonas sp.]|nr:acyltransferase [Luteimonas sp.]
MTVQWTAPSLADAWTGGRNNFNLMRLVAAWMVIYGHAWAITAAGGQDLITRLTQFKFAGGVAVDVFFVISGFLIAASLQRNSVRGYLASRALRIVPALAVCVALSAFVLGPLLTTAADYWQQPDVWRYVWVNASLTSSEYFLPGVFETLPRTAVNGSLWTLTIEARLYLALMFAGWLGLLTSRRYTPLWLLTMACGYAWARWQAPLPDYLADYAWCTAFFITGTTLWVNRARVRLSWWILLALLLAAALTRGGPWFHIPYFLVLCYGTLFVAFVPWLPVIRHNDLSYGLYLYGWPSQQLVQQFIAPGGTPLRNMAWATALALALAGLSWFLVERPALRLKKRFGIRTPAASPASAPA